MAGGKEVEIRKSDVQEPELIETEAAFLPQVAIIEKPDSVLILADLPGMGKDDIDVSIVGDSLRIRGEEKQESRQKEEGYLSVERSYGSFVRTIPLPASVKPDRIEATFKDGVLSVTLPKVELARGRRIEIHGD